MRNRFNIYIIFFSFLILASCADQIPMTENNGGILTTKPPTLGFTRTISIATISPTKTLIPTSARISIVTLINTQTPTSTPTPHPLSIEYLRQYQCPNNEVTIEEELTPGVNYRRYYASYQSDGLKIYALLTVPNGEKPKDGWPVIIFNHGYIPPKQYRTTERYIAYVDAFARNGYIVFRSDYRGHGQSEGIAKGVYGAPDYTIDVLNAVYAIKNYPYADPNRIGMWGHSMGGFITLRAMVVSHDIKAGVIWAGVVGTYPQIFEWFNKDTRFVPAPMLDRSWQDDLLAIYGEPEKNSLGWRQLSANYFLYDLSGPVQLHHGTADEDVPIEFSLRLYEQIQTAGKQVEIYTYEGDDHNISSFFYMAMQRSIEFFDTYLGNGDSR